MARLGTRTPGGPTYDLHQGNLRIDEAATCIASRVLAEAAVTALERRLRPQVLGAPQRDAEGEGAALAGAEQTVQPTAHQVDQLAADRQSRARCPGGRGRGGGRPG